MEVKKYLLMFAFVIFLFITSSESKIFSEVQNELSEHRVVHLNSESRVDDHPHRFRRAVDTAAQKPPPGFSIPTPLPDKNHNEAVVHWSGDNSSVIFVLTREHQPNGTIADSRLWGSVDYGSTFQDKSKLFPKGTVIIYFYVAPLNKEKLVFTDVKNKLLFTTDDEGKTVHKQKISFRPDRLTFHPYHDDWLMAYSYNDTSLYVTRDFAKTWIKVQDHVGSRSYWAVKDLDKDDSTIHMEVLDPVEVTYSYKACAFPYCKDVTVDKSLGNIDIHSLTVQDQYIFVQKSTDFSRSQLFVSYKRQPFREAHFAPKLHPLDFNILDSDEGQVFLAVNHQERVVNLYLSDVTGRFYTKSLDSVVNQHTTAGIMVDLYEAKGIKGVFISNQLVAEQTAKTFITFDKGGNWSLIPAPEKDINGEPTKCKYPECSLHLHLWYSSSSDRNIPYILSDQNAPGIIIAHGVLGNELTLQTANVFISRNGGLTWSELFKGSYIFNILDQGGAVVAVDNNVHSPMNDIRYSCDEGMTWESYNFTTKPIIVDGVLNEPGITTRIVSVYGHENRDAGWMIVKLDFSKILTVKCKRSDYQLWTPADELEGHDCILGSKITYEKRKPKAKCYNGKDYVRQINTTACQCTEDDYECDFGYEKTNGKCNVSSWLDPKLPRGDCPDSTSYNKTDGYRKVAADSCQGGDIHPTTETNCSLVAPSQLSIIPPKKMVLKVKESANFTLIQWQGTKKTTTYTWNFGDGHTLPNLKGFDGNSVQNHSYSSSGHYVVNVTASNSEGRDVANITVDVQEEMLALHVIVPHGVHIYHDISFYATLSPDIKFGDTFYVWHFGDEKQHDRPLLSWNPSVQHNYTRPGMYTVMVQAANAVSTVFRRFNIMVYAKVKTVRLSFSVNMEIANKRTPAWRHLFETSLKEQLMSVLAIERNRLEVVLLTVIPSRADVSILPSPDGADTDLDKVADDLVNSAQQHKIYLTVNGYGVVHVVNASILPDNLHPAKPTSEKERDFTAVYICVPILILAVFVSALVVMHYKKKFMEFRRYSLLRDRNATDALLDEDDDDPPLDPNPDFGLADDDDLVGNEPPALVMMTGDRLHGENQVEC
ncbi:VPS10 domain-containing receptor SorCS1-like [Lineus longissimus]|uniref:VPS10 domain-containing receptor SorCS1-like n=1 Tax=Lineus longissimus TaxID=88925 RepID=UPI002B4F0173